MKDLYDKLDEAMEEMAGERALGDISTKTVEYELIRIVEKHTGKRLVKTKIIKIEVLE